MSTRQTIIIILLFLVVASGWFLRNMESGSPAATEQQRGPDMFAEQIDVTVMDDNGQPAYRITAERLQHSPDSESFDLTRPAITTKHPRGDNWNIASERGRMTEKGDLLWFSGEVNIHRRGSNALHIRTSEILVKPEEELAETDRAVTISAALYEIDAIGLKADFRNKLLELRSRVRGTIHAAS